MAATRTSCFPTHFSSTPYVRRPPVAQPQGKVGPGGAEHNPPAMPKVPPGPGWASRGRAEPHGAAAAPHGPAPATRPRPSRGGWRGAGAPPAATATAAWGLRRGSEGPSAQPAPPQRELGTRNRSLLSQNMSIGASAQLLFYFIFLIFNNLNIFYRYL